MTTVESTQFATQSIPRALVRRFVPPPVLQFTRRQWWNLSSYLPRLVSSQFATSRPEVRGFGTVNADMHVNEKLKRVNVVAPTKMCRIITKYGSDKGRLHRYTTIYSSLFRERDHEPLRIFELGLGTNDPNLPSSMGVFGAPGASLRGWRELFPLARIYGADIDRKILFSEDRIKTFYCNQLDRSSIRELWSHPDLQGGLDILIEDGLHTFEANMTFLEESLANLRPGGIYITEDILASDLEKWYRQIENIYSKQYIGHEFVLVSLANTANRDNNLLVIRRPPAM
jgi:hypothetical protein